MSSLEYKKAAMFTDIHFGAKNNLLEHNQDCYNFVKWFCEKIKEDDSIDHVIFLGDWFEHRNSVNIQTIEFSLDAAKLLNDLNIPIFMIVGNHDLYHRTSRKYSASSIFKNLNNITLIKEEPLVFNNDTSVLFPFLFEEEYYSLLKDYKKYPWWFGHFEFKGFIITGYNHKMEHGPEHKDFNKQKRIFSGHFHKRQAQDNVYYIGNTFPKDFSDVNDDERGMTIYDYENDIIIHHQWPDAPSYKIKKLSKIINDNNNLSDVDEKTHLKINVDTLLPYNEIIELKQKLLEESNLNEVILIDEIEIESEDDDIEIENIEEKTTDDIIVELLANIEADDIDNNILINEYKSLKEAEND